MSQKVVVITGATRGLGHSLAVEFANRGFRVAGCGRSESPAKHIHAVDVTDEEAVNTWAKHLIQTLGPPDILINNAGIINKTASLWEVPLQEFSEVITINIMGTVLPLRAFIPSMLKKGSGTIINISSYWGKHGEAMFSPYCTSKFAIEGLTQSLAKELPKELVTVALDPGGGINTEMFRSFAPERADYLPHPDSWAKWATDFITSLTHEHHGKALTCPHH